MPIKKVTVTYLCKICLIREYESREGALSCEERGVAIPEFKRYEVVELFGLLAAQATVSSGYKVKVRDGTRGVVCDEGGDKHDPHRLPFYYEVWIQTIGGPYKKELALISRESLGKVTVKDGTICPLCSSSAKISKDVCSPFLTMGNGLPLLTNMPLQKCSHCNIEFFTTEQSERVELLVKKKTKWSLANTQRLIKEHLFNY